MTTNFTPEPWTWEDSPLSRVADRRTFLAGNGTNILIHNAAWEVSEDDKNLIAAAPEMYEALVRAEKKIASIVEVMGVAVEREEGRITPAYQLLKDVRSAIAKAQGGAA